MSYKYQGYSTDASKVYMDINGNNHTFIWAGRIYLNNVCYMVLEATANSQYVEAEKLYVFEFDGDPKTLCGSFEPVESDSIREEVFDKFFELLEEQEKKEQEQQPKKKETPKKKEQSKSYNDSDLMEPMLYKGKKSAALRNVCYYLAMAYGVFQFFSFFLAFGKSTVFAFFTSFVLYSPLFDLMSASSSIYVQLFMLVMIAVLILFPVLGIITSFLAVKKGWDNKATIHNTVMVIGVFCVNPFMLLAGFFNHLSIKAQYKIYPVSE